MISDLDVYLNSLVKKKPYDLIFLDLTNLNTMADFFIICHGKSTRQAIAIAEHIKIDLKKLDIRPISHEGFREGHWIILDYGRIVLHVFHESFRRFYDLEGLWSDAKMFKVNENKTTHSTKIQNINEPIEVKSSVID